MPPNLSVMRNIFIYLLSILYIIYTHMSEMKLGGGKKY